ncbi:hypothetical protein O181_097158 [Austropuccinia psidii MF-1]|uniref:Uncharacterized protein n=1 Tax=Austropuccinia psidii MF-1 TaxID=1389203 RepID=A0A9Q3J8D0_9BASI|nr:hypothetical protein [Austropuccinia psidii MF-1]
MAQIYRAEAKQQGKRKMVLQQGAVLKRRNRLQKCLYEFGESVRREWEKITTPPHIIPSSCNRVPKGLPIDFYDPGWYNNCTLGQKVGLADTRNVAFLLDVSNSIKGNQDPNETLDSQTFSKKYLDLKIQKYKLPEDMVPEVESDDSENEINASSADIDEGSFLDDEDERSDSDTEMAHAGDPGIFAVPRGNAWEGW